MKGEEHGYRNADHGLSQLGISSWVAFNRHGVSEASSSGVLDDLLLPYTFDISLFNQIDNVDLIDHIKRVGKIIYKKDKAGILNQ